MDSHDSFRTRRLLHEAILDLCDIIEELNEQCEGGDDPDRPEWRGPQGYG